MMEKRGAETMDELEFDLKPEESGEPCDAAPQQDIVPEAPSADALPEDIPPEAPFADSPPEDIPPEAPFADSLPEDIPPEAPFADSLPEPDGTMLAPLFPEDTQETLPDAAPEMQENAAAPEMQENDGEPKKEKIRKPRPKLRRALKITKWVFFVLLTVALLATLLIGYLTITEYRPAYAENPEQGNVRVDEIFSGNTLRVLTINTGYGGLDRTEDFFMDGGKGVHPDTQAQVEKNMIGLEGIIRSVNADVVLMQEVDTGSKRSFGINQWRQYEFDLEDYESRYALNYCCAYVPYPLPTIGKIRSGIATFSRYDISAATRYALPCPFQWPVRVANLKRCLLVTRLPVEGKTQELVIVNLHLEAYDDGEGKAAQTQMLMQLLQEEYEKGNYVIAGGDFNQSFPGALSAYPTKDTSNWVPGTLEALPDGWSYAYDCSVPTCRLLNQPYNEASALTQYYGIDGFIVSDNLEVTRIETLDEGFTFTDHNPVVLEVLLK